MCKGLSLYFLPFRQLSSTPKQYQRASKKKKKKAKLDARVYLKVYYQSHAMIHMNKDIAFIFVVFIKFLLEVEFVRLLRTSVIVRSVSF